MGLSDHGLAEYKVFHILKLRQLKPRSASLSRLSTPTRTFEDDDEPVSSRLSRGRSRLGSVSRLDDDDCYTSPNSLQDVDVKEELRRINEQLHSAKLKPGLPVGPRSYVDTPRITQSEGEEG